MRSYWTCDYFVHSSANANGDPSVRWTLEPWRGVRDSQVSGLFRFTGASSGRRGIAVSER